MSTFEIKNNSDGTILRGQIWAAKAPKAVMSLVHGFGEHSGRYADMARYLNSKNISVVTLDLRGHGQSEGRRGYCPDYSQLLGDVDALLAKSRETNPNLPHMLYGHSMGGGIVLNHQLKSGGASISAVIASAPFIQPADSISKPQRIIVKFLGKVAPKMSLGNKLMRVKFRACPPSKRPIYLTPLIMGIWVLASPLAWLKVGSGLWKMPRIGNHHY